MLAFERESPSPTPTHPALSSPPLRSGFHVFCAQFKYAFYSSSGIPIPIPGCNDCLFFLGLAFSTRGELGVSPSIPLYLGKITTGQDAKSTEDATLNAHVWLNAKLTFPITKNSGKGGDQNPSAVGKAELDGKIGMHTVIAGQPTGFGVAGLLFNLVTGNTDISDVSAAL